MSTPEDTPPEKKPEDAAVPTEAAKTIVPEDTSAADKPAKPKFKVTRSPFAPKVEGTAAKPGPINLSKPAEAPAAAKPAEAPKPAAPKPMAPKAPSPIAGQATPPAPKPFGVAPHAPHAQHAPVSPKPVAPVSARKAAEMAEEEDSKFSPILMAVDAIAAIVAISFGVLIILNMKG